ncbi:hypothetical protein JCM3765_006590 [Sporobolomyces pararoseus]
MCIAEATLVYGLTVRSADLVFAADAFTRLRPILPFFEFILLRRRSGGLVSSPIGRGPELITKVPDDVWERIRHWLIKEEMAESEDTLIGPLLCDDPTCEVRPHPSQRMTWERLDAMRWDDCSRCEEAFLQFATECIKDWNEPVLSRWYDEAAYSASALIAAPSVFKVGESEEALIYTKPDDGGGQPEHTIVDVSTANLPPNIDQRFARLVKLFSLEVVDATSNKIAPQLGKSADRTSRRKPSNEAEVTSEVRPSWKVHLVYNGAYRDLLYSLTVGAQGALDPFHRLVAAFGLDHPLPRTIVLERDVWNSLDDIAFISIPCGAQRRGSYHSTISAKAGYEDQDDQTIIDVSFDLLPDADLRFLRFVRTFNLKVVEISNGTLKSIPPDPQAKPLLQSELAGFKTGPYAWKSLEPTFRFFDLLFLRKRQDTLVVNNRDLHRRSSLEKVPEEVWEEIRNLIAEEIVSSAEFESLIEFVDSCGDETCRCHDSDEVRWGKMNRDPNIYRTGSLESFFGGFLLGRVKSFEPIHHLLTYFGLAHPLTRFIPLNPDVSPDFQSVALIALPSRTDIRSHTTISGEHSEAHDQHTMVDVSLKLPLDADSRFVRFVRLFNLQVVSTSISTLRITNQVVLKDQEQEAEAKDDDSEKHGQKKKLRNKIAPLAGLIGLKNEEKLKEIKPEWKLYTACDAGFQRYGECE